ncbi:MAG: C1 family peptidase [Chlamydiae bacterium]|nr:C1 family peptidase [Chlamydiota bacterium]
MKISKSFLLFCLTSQMNFLFANLTNQGFEHYGLYSFSEEELQEIEKNASKVDEVVPNKLGATRIYGHENGKQIYYENFKDLGEFSYYQDSTSSSVSFLSSSSTITSNLGASLPSRVDNSLLPSFPPIGNQLNLGSCVGWASTYYQASHELGLLNGFNNKTSNQYVLSPKWTYNLLNGGVNYGLNPYDAYNLLNVCGAVSIASLPYDSNYLAWDLNFQDWINATKNRFLKATLISGLNLGNRQDLTAIKSALNNGHVLTFGTYINSWVTTKIKRDPRRINNLYFNEYAVRYMNGQKGGHMMTIVGYDDTIWIDVNNSGKEDSGERGAFKVANSWGTGWGNQGYIWISYDAFRSVSGVKNMNKISRVPLAAPLNSAAILAVPVKANYTPSLLSTFTIDQGRRNQLKVSVGASSSGTAQPQTSITIPALNYSGGPFDFAGTSNSTSSTKFAIDLTDFAQSAQNFSRYYLICQDSTKNFATTLSGYTLVDIQRNATIPSSYDTTTFDNSYVAQYIDYTFLQSQGIYQQPTSAKITSHSNNQKVQGKIQINVHASSGHDIQHVDLYYNDIFIERDHEAPYQFYVNTTAFKNGKGLFHAIATDSLNNKVTSSVSLDIRNPTRPNKTQKRGFYEEDIEVNIPYILIEE